MATPGIRVAPSVLSADFGHLAEAVSAVESAGAELLHLDIMDGHFVPNISFGVPVVASIRTCTNLFLDAHLMISDPHRYAKPFVEAGCDHLTFHIETTDQPLALVEHIRNLGVTVGVSLNPTTPASAIDPILEHVDLVLVMSVWPGFGGQRFIPEVLAKVRTLRTRLESHQRLQIDGGIDVQTVGLAAKAGADTFVAGTAVFAQADPAEAFRNLSRLAREAVGEKDA